MKSTKQKRQIVHAEAKRAAKEGKVSGFVSEKPTAVKAVIGFIEREKLVTALTVARKFRITERAASVRLWRCRLAGFVTTTEKDGKRVFVIAESRPEPRRRRKAAITSATEAGNATRRLCAPTRPMISPADLGITPS